VTSLHAVSGGYGLNVSVFYPCGSFSFLFTALAFLTNMSEKHKSASPSTIQVQNRQKTIGTEEQSCVIM
jgi:hypothetical protein